MDGIILYTLDGITSTIPKVVTVSTFNSYLHCSLPGLVDHGWFALDIQS